MNPLHQSQRTTDFNYDRDTEMSHLHSMERRDLSKSTSNISKLTSRSNKYGQKLKEVFKELINPSIIMGEVRGVSSSIRCRSLDTLAQNSEEPAILLQSLGPKPGMDKESDNYCTSDSMVIGNESTSTGHSFSGIMDSSETNSSIGKNLKITIPVVKPADFHLTKICENGNFKEHSSNDVKTVSTNNLESSQKIHFKYNEAVTSSVDQLEDNNENINDICNPKAPILTKLEKVHPSVDNITTICSSLKDEISTTTSHATIEAAYKPNSLDVSTNNINNKIYDANTDEKFSEMDNPTALITNQQKESGICQRKSNFTRVPRLAELAKLYSSSDLNPTTAIISVSDATDTGTKSRSLSIVKRPHKNESIQNDLTETFANENVHKTSLAETRSPPEIKNRASYIFDSTNMSSDNLSTFYVADIKSKSDNNINDIKVVPTQVSENFADVLERSLDFDVNHNTMITEAFHVSPREDAVENAARLTTTNLSRNSSISLEAIIKEDTQTITTGCSRIEPLEILIAGHVQHEASNKALSETTPAVNHITKHAKEKPSMLRAPISIDLETSKIKISTYTQSETVQNYIESEASSAAVRLETDQTYTITNQLKTVVSTDTPIGVGVETIYPGTFDTPDKIKYEAANNTQDERSVTQSIGNSHKIASADTISSSNIVNPNTLTGAMQFVKDLPYGSHSASTNIDVTPIFKGSPVARTIKIPPERLIESIEGHDVERCIKTTIKSHKGNTGKTVINAVRKRSLTQTKASAVLAPKLMVTMPNRSSTSRSKPAASGSLIVPRQTKNPELKKVAVQPKNNNTKIPNAIKKEPINTCNTTSKKSHVERKRNIAPKASDNKKVSTISVVSAQTKNLRLKKVAIQPKNNNTKIPNAIKKEPRSTCNTTPKNSHIEKKRSIAPKASNNKKVSTKIADVSANHSRKGSVKCSAKSTVKTRIVSPKTPNVSLVKPNTSVTPKTHTIETLKAYSAGRNRSKTHKTVKSNNNFTPKTPTGAMVGKQTRISISASKCTVAYNITPRSHRMAERQVLNLSSKFSVGYGSIGTTDYKSSNNSVSKMVMKQNSHVVQRSPSNVWPVNQTLNKKNSPKSGTGRKCICQPSCLF